MSKMLYLIIAVFFFFCIALVTSQSYGYNNPTIPKLNPQTTSSIINYNNYTNVTNIYGTNSTYNETYASFSYNESNFITSTYNNSWLSTFNQTYHNALIYSYNFTEIVASTYNVTYHTWAYNQTQSMFFYNMTNTPFFYNMSDTMYFYNQTSGSGWTTRGTTVSLITSTNNVGIGQPQSGIKLTINATEVTGGTQILRLETTTKAIESGGGILSFGHGGQNISYLYSSSGAGNSAPFLTFAVSKDTGQPSERLRITEDGYVGIGTSTPSHRLNVINDINVTGNIYGDIVNFQFTNPSTPTSNITIAQLTPLNMSMHGNRMGGGYGFVVARSGSIAHFTVSFDMNVLNGNSTTASVMTMWKNATRFWYGEISRVNATKQVKTFVMNRGDYNFSAGDVLNIEQNVTLSSLPQARFNNMFGDVGLYYD